MITLIDPMTTHELKDVNLWTNTFIIIFKPSISKKSILPVLFKNSNKYT